MTTGRQAVDPRALTEAVLAIAEIDDLEGWAGRFALLSDPTRLRLLFCLHRTGGLCVSDLAEAVEMSTSSVSHALRLMRERGWVRPVRHGRTVVYELVDETVHDLLHRIGARHSPGAGHRDDHLAEAGHDHPGAGRSSGAGDGGSAGPRRAPRS